MFVDIETVEFFSPEYTLKTQVIGVLSTVAYVLVMAIIVFTIIDKTVGLRVTKGEDSDEDTACETAYAVDTDRTYRVINLGVFILWFCWFGFNCGSTTAASTNLGDIAMTTNLAAAAATLATLVVTWNR